MTKIRNYFAHSYEKDFLEDKTFVRINLNHHLNEGLYELEVFDFKNSQKIFGIFFSLNVYSNEIQRLINELISEIEKNS